MAGTSPSLHRHHNIIKNKKLSQSYFTKRHDDTLRGGLCWCSHITVQRMYSRHAMFRLVILHLSKRLRTFRATGTRRHGATLRPHDNGTGVLFSGSVGERNLFFENLSRLNGVQFFVTRQESIKTLSKNKCNYRPFSR